MSAWTVIAHQELSSAQNEIEFLSIPATYDDLVLVTSLRTNGGGDDNIIRLSLTFNDTTANRSVRSLYGYNGSVASDSSASNISWFYAVANTATASTFANNQFYIPNYRGNTNKSISMDSVTENNSANAIASIAAGLWSNTAAITSIQIFPNDDVVSQFVQYSSATLYGITKGSSGGVTVS